MPSFHLKTKTFVQNKPILFCLLFVLLAIFFPPFPRVDAQASCIQSAVGSGSGSSRSLGFPLVNTAGNLIVVSAGWGSGTVTATVADTAGNTYLTAVGPATNGTLRAQIWYAQNIKAGTNAITVSFSSSVGHNVIIHEYSGLATTNALDVTASGTGSGNNPTTPTVTPTQAEVLLFGYSNNSGPVSWTAGPGYTIRSTTSRGASEDRMVSASGSYNASYTTSASGSWNMLFAVFKQASAILDITPPSVTITNPVAASTVSSTITVAADAFDDVAVAGVQFKLDGSNLGGEDTATPYEISWDTATAVNGNHTLTVVARDLAGNTTTSNPITVNVSNALPPPPPPPSGDLVGYWKFDENAGTTTVDSSGNGNSGTLINGPAWISGQVNSALNFDGLDDVVNVGSGPTLDNLPALTISAWIRPVSNGEGGYGRIVHKGGGTAAPTGFLFNLRGTGQIEFTVDFSSTDLKRTSASGVIGTAGVWQHAAATWDGSASGTGVHIYVNGAEVSYSGTSSAAGSRVDDSLLNFLIGNNSNTSRTFSGALDEVKIYNRVLNQSEIQALAQTGPPPPDTTPPFVPTGLTATAISSSQINLSWIASTDNVGVTGYHIYRNSIQVATTASTFYSDIALSPSTTYTYTVAAHDAAGNVSAQSSPASATTQSAPLTFTCTEILGFSQTRGWFLAGFESVTGIDNALWQARLRDFAGIEMWTDPNFVGWTDPAYFYSPCTTSSTNPDRVVLTITSVPSISDLPPGYSGIYPKVVAADWVSDIQTTIANIRARYSNVKQIVLQPVIGGPNHQTCFISGTPVRASVNHPIIDQAISMVIGGDVVAGISPEVRTCADYSDTLGHQTASGYAYQASNIGTYYASFNPDTTPPATVTSLSASVGSASSVTLAWTAPGDDAAAGTAASYDVRYSTSGITDTTWDLATPATGEPIPAPAGTTQSMVISGLQTGTTYFFALKTSDEVPNTSLLSNIAGATPGATPPNTFACTQVIGLSSTRQWYILGGQFEPTVGDDKWQIIQQDNAFVDRWADPNYSGWSLTVQSPCVQSSNIPDRVVLNIASGLYQGDVNWWMQNISNAVATIRSKIPSALQIVLMPTPGGPGNTLCNVTNVNTSYSVPRGPFNDLYIDVAIAQLMESGVLGSDVISGPSPEVRTCADYSDSVGHLTTGSRGPIGQMIGEYFVSGTLPSQPAPPVTLPMRLNVMGGARVDSLGNTWVPDRSYSLGSYGYVGNSFIDETLSAIADTTEDTLYQKHRRSGSGTSFSYLFDVPNGTYNVRLMFAEIAPSSFAVGARVGDYWIENTLVLDNFDVFAQAGAGNTAIDRNFAVTVSDGQLNIAIVPVVGQPAINAIEVTPI